MSSVFDFFESNPEAFDVLWFGSLVLVLIVFFFGGRKAEEKFKGLELQSITFREKGASGRSLKSLATRLGSATRVLDVIVTDRELWIKGIWPAFTFIGTRFDLSHRVPLDRVGAASVEGSTVTFTIRDDVGNDSRIELGLRKPEDFIGAIGSRH